MKHICIIHRDPVFEEFYQEISSWDDVQIVDPSDAKYDQADHPDVHYHIWGQREWFSVAHLLPSRRACRMTYRYVEQLPENDAAELSDYQQPMFRTFLDVAGYFDEIYFSAKASQSILQRFLPGLADRIVRVPMGYTPFLGSPNFDCEQDIDIMIYGGRSPRRDEIVNKIGARLADLNLLAITGVWGEERNELIRRSKILLHIQNLPRQFPGFRMWRALANGAFWVTEEVVDPSPMLTNEDLVEIPTITSENVYRVCQTLRSWINRPRERDVIRRRGHEHAKQFPMRRQFEELMRRAESLAIRPSLLRTLV